MNNFSAIEYIKSNYSILTKRLFASFFVAWSILYIIFPEGIFKKEYASDARLALVLAITAATFAAMSCIRLFGSIKKYKTDSYLLLFSSCIMAVWLSIRSYNENGTDFTVFLVLMPICALCIYHTIYKDEIVLPGFSHKLWFILILLAASGMFFFCGITMIFRYYSLYCPSFDFGIFAQMFENMKDTFLPDTTVERNYFLSHFAVHFSPAYYLLLPFYMLFPHPVTLQVLQGLLITSAVIPVYLICRRRNMSKLLSSFICVAFAFYPAFTGGVCYDFHENCMLVPLLFWLFYSIERKSIPLITLFSLLIFTVKEDAPIYVAVIGLYLIISSDTKKMKLTGLCVLAGSVVYFFIACEIINSFGLGIQTWRYSEYDYNDGGLISVIKSVIANPALMFNKLFSAEKAEFVIQMLAPLVFIPFISKKFSRYILIIPFVLINLMPSYVYQHSIWFQYVFGSGVFLFYLFIINISDMNIKSAKSLSALSVVSCAMMFIITMSGMTGNIKIATASPERTETIKYLESFENDGRSISADTFFIPALYKQKNLFSINNGGNELNSDKFIVSDIMLLNRKNSSFIEYYTFLTENKGYVEIVIDDNLVSKMVCRLEKPE